MISKPTEMLDKLVEIDRKIVDKLFSLLLLCFTVSIILLTPDLDRMARTVPLVVSVPTVALLTALIIYQNVPAVSKQIDQRISSSDVFDAGEKIDELGGDSEKELERDTRDKNKKVWKISFWILLTFVSIIFVGFLPSILLFLILFYRLEARQSWTSNVLYSISVWIGIVVLFEIVLGTGLYQGILGIDLLELVP